MGIANALRKSRGQDPFRPGLRTAPFKPTVVPKRPPSGTYDPALDAQERAAGRGFGDLQQDTGRDQGRLTEDFALGVRDVEQSFGRGRDDLATALQRGEQDYGSSTQNLVRSYGRLGDAQAQQAQQAGVVGGGTLAAALRARQENQGLEQGVLDTGIGRFREDNARSLGRITEDRDQGVGRLTLGHQRGQDDLATNLGRGGRENTAFGQDVAEQRFFQAGQTGWQMPKPGRWEGKDAKGPFRIRRLNGRRVKVRPNGTIDRA